MKKYFSYTELRAFEADRDDYYRHYIEGEEFQPSLAMKIGTHIHEYLKEPAYPLIKELSGLNIEPSRLETIAKMMKKLDAIRAPEREISMVAKLGDIKLFAKLDGFYKTDRKIVDYKTTDEPDNWQQRVVDYHPQLTFYALVYWLSYWRFLRSMEIYRIDTLTGSVVRRETVRSRSDIEAMKQRVLSAVAELKSLDWWEKRLSRNDQLTKNQLALSV